jgi:hypothetical protein
VHGKLLRREAICFIQTLLYMDHTHVSCEQLNNAAVSPHGAHSESCEVEDGVVWVDRVVRMVVDDVLLLFVELLATQLLMQSVNDAAMLHVSHIICISFPRCRSSCAQILLTSDALASPMY